MRVLFLTDGTKHTQSAIHRARYFSEYLTDLGHDSTVFYGIEGTLLARRFNRFKMTDDTLASMKQMRDARQKNLDAAQQKLSAMVNAKRKLEVDVQNLEAKRKLVEVAQASSEYVFDDSQLACCKELITDIHTRLDVAAKLANADVKVDAEIPLDDATPADITAQVSDYFKLNGKAEAAPKTEVAAAGFAHE